MNILIYNHHECSHKDWVYCIVETNQLKHFINNTYFEGFDEPPESVDTFEDALYWLEHSEYPYMLCYFLDDQQLNAFINGSREKLVRKSTRFTLKCKIENNPDLSLNDIKHQILDAL